MSELKLDAPSPLLLDGNVADNWDKFKQRFDFYLEATGYDEKSAKIQASLFLHTIGPCALEVYNTFEFTDEADRKKLEVLKAKFETYCKPKKNITFQRHKFFSRNQIEGESVDRWVTDLRKLAASCEFGTLKDELIKDVMVLGIHDHGTKERLLRDQDLSLDKAILMCRATETSKKQLQELSNTTNVLDVNATKIQSNHSRTMPKTQIRDCRFCGGSHVAGNCPAYGKSCTTCGKRNHFAKVCRSKDTQQTSIQANSVQIPRAYAPIQEERPFFVGAIGAQQGNQWTERITIYNKPIVVRIDTGAEISVMPLSTFTAITDKPLGPFTQKLVGVGNKKIEALGKITLTVKSEVAPKGVEESFVVVPNNVYDDVLLTGDASEKLGFITRKVGSIKLDHPYKAIMNKYSTLFSGIGRASKFEYSAELKENSSPVSIPSRRVAYSLMEPLKKCLETMVSDGVVSKLTEASDWCSPLVITTKSGGDLRLCLDPQHLNKCLKRQRYPMPVIQDTLADIHKAKVFSKFDLKCAFWQIPVDEATSRLFCFGTPFGRYRFNRMPYGINPASEVCQQLMDDVLEGLPGVKVAVDDILVYSKTHDEHQKTIEELFERLKTHNLTLNLEKAEVAVSELIFLGIKVSANGLSPDDSKVEAIKNMKEPRNRTELRRILGSMLFLKDFIPNMSTVLAPLYALLREANLFEFDTNCQRAFQNAKEILSSEPVLRHYDPQLPLKLVVDASKAGLGAVIMQETTPNRWLPIKYASRTLLDTETRWAAIEIETMAILFGLERFHAYTLGNPVTVETDHKPLLAIFQKPINDVSLRIQKMRLKLLRYKFELTHIPGTLTTSQICYHERLTQIQFQQHCNRMMT